MSQEDLIEENLVQEQLDMKDNPSNSATVHTSGSNANGAQLNGIHRVNGNSKRKNYGALQNDSRPAKKQTVYMDVSDEEGIGGSPKVERTLANGISASPLGRNRVRKKKSKGNIGYGVEGNAKYLTLQEQRKQLPIARGTCKNLYPESTW